MCLYPKLILNKKYTATKKNGGKIPPVLDKRTLYVPMKCGHCMECMKQKAQGFRVRLLEEIKTDDKCTMVTLTFSNEEYTKLSNAIWLKHWGSLNAYETDNEIATLAVDRFLERWRKDTKKFPKHWLVTELGHNGTENIHLHGLIWAGDKTEEYIRQKWKYGFVRFGHDITEKTINYIVKYVMKTDEMHTQYEPKVLTSKGIGKNFADTLNAKLNRFKGKETDELYTTREGKKQAMPIYYRNKIYSEEEREKLWIQRLEKNERWVDGVKIRADDTDAYYAQLSIARAKGLRLGYRQGEKNWEKSEYEMMRRELLQEQRKAKELEEMRG